MTKGQIEEARLYQAAQLVRYEVNPFIGSGLGDLDDERLANCFREGPRG